MPDQTDQELNERVAKILISVRRNPWFDTGEDQPKWSTNITDALRDLWPDLREVGWVIGLERFSPFFWIGHEQHGVYASTDDVSRFAHHIAGAWVAMRKGKE